MILTLDIGNSAVKGGLFDGNTLTSVFHVDIAPSGTAGAEDADRWARALRTPLRESLRSDATIQRVGVVSVVPDALPAAETALRQITNARVATIHTGMALPFTLAYETPQTLGGDRLAAAVAAWTQHGAPASRSVLAVDAGTAVTYDIVDADGVYRGGAIGAGPALTQQALRAGTAQLPTVPLTFPDDVLGTSTQTALQSGILWGFVGSVRGMIDRLADRLPHAPVVVLTGGWHDVLAARLDGIDHADPHLVLRGVRVLLALNE